MIKYGLISETDARTLEKTIDLICSEFNDELLDVLEVGIYAGETGDGLRRYIESKGRQAFKTGVDNDKDEEPIRFHYHQLIIGDADEVAFKIQDNSQHICFIDACHCNAHTISNFFSYAPKVKKGGYFAFHDTGKHIKQFKDFQHGDEENPDAYISVRKALVKIGLFEIGWEEKYKNNYRTYTGGFGFELIFDEADETNEAGGICVFKKLY